MLRLNYQSNQCIENLQGFCTGEFVEIGTNGQNERPPAGTKCEDPCVMETGQWGNSWCYTEAGSGNGRQWGAECVQCPGNHTM